MVHIQIFTKPIPKARARFNTRSGRAYTPRTTQDYESHIKNEARKHFKVPLEGAIEMRLIFNFVKAKSSKKVLHTQRPDLDNLCKAIMDGLNKIAFIDDCQVVYLVCSKKFAEKESVEIFIGEVP